MAEVLTELKRSDATGNWTCPACTLLNSAGATRCNACDNLRPAGSFCSNSSGVVVVVDDDVALAPTPLAGAGRGQAQEAASQHPSSSSSGLKRSATILLCEAVGVSRRVARRLLNDAGGDPSRAAGHALMIQDLEQGQNSQLKTNDKSEQCSICIETFGRGEAAKLLPCQHGWYCFDCLRRAADVKIANGATLGAICCPACNLELSEVVLRALLGTEQMDKLHRQSVEAAVAASSELRPCPTPDCPNRVALEDGMTPRLQCEMCGKEHCLLCSASPYHTGKSCQEHLAETQGQSSEADLRKWMSKVGAKQCPKCKMVVTKQSMKDQATQASECHKMICRACRTRFCFGCLTILTESSTCGCTPDNHGFIDPDTGAFVQHLTPARRHRRRAGPSQ
mmetsp:Transcript_344/g.606  ORF Transcript_344/g.606 Transcript_344/m.606 type:complete len:394 (+) Transcript_344:99-1280(+)